LSAPDPPSKKTRVLLIGPHPVRNRDLLASKLDDGFALETWVPDDGKAALTDRLRAADAAICMRWDRDMPPAPKLRLLQLPGAGFDKIDFGALPGNCDVCNVFEHETGIAEYVLAAMLELSIGLRRIDASFRLGNWTGSTTRADPPHGELSGKTVGLVGYGHIGQAVAARAKAFDTRLIAVTRSPRDDAGDLAWIGTMDRLPDLLAEADFVVLACVLAPNTRHLINAETLALMKPIACLINVARGEVVDEDALYGALKDRTIAGAAVDVWYRYPTTDEPNIRPGRNPFHALDNIIMTPHLSGNTDQLWERRFTAIADNLKRFRDGRNLRNAVEWLVFE